MKYWKGLLAVIASLCLAFCLMPGIAVAGDTVPVSIDAPDEVLEGSDFIANVNVTGVVDFDSCGFDVTYDQSIITVTDVTDGEIEGDTIPVNEWHYIPVDTVDTGRIRVATYMPGMPAPGVTGSGYIAQIHFHVLGSAPSTSAIHLETVGMYNYLADEIPTTTQDASVKVYAPPPPEYTITFDTDPEATGSITFDGVSYTDGNTVDKAADTYSIVAHPGSGYTFDSWETTGGLSVTAPSSATTTCAVSGAGTLRMVQTTAPPITYTLAVTCDPAAGGSVTLNPSQPVGGYAAGTSVELTATPEDGYAFGSWGGDLTGSANPDTIVMDSDKNVTANFIEIPPVVYYTLTVNISPSGSGTVSLSPGDQDPATPGNQYEEDTTVHLTASPTSGYEFDHWSGHASGTSTTTSVIMTDDKSVTAHFSELPAPPPPAVGGTAYPPNKLAILAPWIALAAAIIAGAAIFVRRRRAQS